MILIKTAQVWPNHYVDDEFVVRVVERHEEHSRFTILYRGTRQQCTDWLRTALHQKKIR
jgi:hypothetical protein